MESEAKSGNIEAIIEEVTTTLENKQNDSDTACLKSAKSERSEK